VSASRSCFSLRCPPRRGPQPPAVPVGPHSGVACRICASEVRSTFLRACMRDDRRTIHRLSSSETLEARDGIALRGARCRTCCVLISSKFLLKNLAPPGARPGLVTVRATVRVHVVADRLFASSSRMCRYFCRQPVTKKTFRQPMICKGFNFTVGTKLDAG